MDRGAGTPKALVFAILITAPAAVRAFGRDDMMLESIINRITALETLAASQAAEIVSLKDEVARLTIPRKKGQLEWTTLDEDAATGKMPPETVFGTELVATEKRRLSERFLPRPRTAPSREGVRRLQSRSGGATLHLHSETSQIWFGTGGTPDLKLLKKDGSLVTSVNGNDKLTVAASGTTVDGHLAVGSISGDGSSLVGVLHAGGKISQGSFSTASGCVACEDGRYIVSGGGACGGGATLVSSGPGSGLQANGWCVAYSFSGSHTATAVCA